MKTLLFAPCIVDTPDRLARNLKWLEYYTPLLSKLNVDKIVLIDNASPVENLKQIESKYPDVHIVKKTIRLERIKTDAYGYWYRAFAEAAKYALENGYNKIIHIDSDVFIFTERIVDYLVKAEDTWTGFWCDIHKYNETIFQVCAGKKHIENMYLFMSEGFLQFYPFDIAEKRVPFTHVEKNFIGDRFPEKHIFVQDPSWDWCGQCPTNMKVKFNK